MSSIYEEFDKNFDGKKLKIDLSGVEQKEVPHGIYEVKITKLELTKTKTSGKPMVVCWFKILAGQHKDRFIFMNTVLANGFMLHKCNEFLRSISRLPVSFQSFSQYGKLLNDIMAEIEDTREYQLNYSKDFKGYNAFRIEEVAILSDAL